MEGLPETDITSVAGTVCVRVLVLAPVDEAGAEEAGLV